MLQWKLDLTYLHSGNVSKEMRASLFGKSEISSERFASSKSWNWKAGAQVQPTREKWVSLSLGGALSTVPSGEMLMSFVGKEPNHTFEGTVYCGCWLSRRLGPRQVSFTCPSLSFNSTTWKKISIWWWKKMLKKKQSNYIGKEGCMTESCTDFSISTRCLIKTCDQSWNAILQLRDELNTTLWVLFMFQSFSMTILWRPC